MRLSESTLAYCPNIGVHYRLDAVLMIRTYFKICLFSGNCDTACEDRNMQDVFTNATYLEHESVEIEGIKIFGSAWQPAFCGAFNLPRGKALESKWSEIPDDTDILITHTPAFGILDSVGNRHVGCEALLDAIERVKPKYSICGHIHENGGKSFSMDGTTFMNVAVYSGNAVVRDPMVFEY